MKIITHPGPFHADEICAIALLKIVGIAVTSIERREPTEKDFYDLETFVIDIGSQYNPDFLLFDHHQNAALESSNVLILEYLLTIEKIDKAAYDFIYAKLFARVSMVDRGIVKCAPYELSSLLRSLNFSEDFDMALNLTIQLITPMVYNAMNISAFEKAWDELPIQHGFFKASPPGTNLQGWKALAAKDGTKYLISPSVRGGYNIISADSNRFPIPATSKQTFLHNNRFLAMYLSAQDAIDDVKTFSYELTN